MVGETPTMAKKVSRKERSGRCPTEYAERNNVFTQTRNEAAQAPIIFYCTSIFCVNCFSLFVSLTRYCPGGIVANVILI